MCGGYDTKVTLGLMVKVGVVAFNIGRKIVLGVHKVYV